MLRILLYIIGIPLLLILLAAILLPLVLDEEQLLALAAERLEQSSGAQLTVHGDSRLSLLPRLALTLDEAELALPGKDQPDITVQRLAVEVRLLPLLSGTVAIKGIELAGLVATVPAQPAQPAVDTSTLSDAELDAFYEARRQAVRDAAANSAGAALGLPLALNVQRLNISDARIVLLQADGGEPRMIELVALTATDMNLAGEPAALNLQLRIPGANPVALSLDLRFSADLDQQRVQLQSLVADIEGATRQPLQLRASGPVDLERQVAELELALESGTMTGAGNLRYASFESPQIDTTLQLSELNPALLVLAGPEAATEAGDVEADGDAPLPLHALRLVDTRAALQVERAVFGLHSIEQLQLKLRVVEGIATLETIRGRLHGGELDASAVLNGQHNTARLETRGELTGADTALLLAALEAQPVLSGSASLDWQLTGSGRSRNELVQGLDGTVELTTGGLALEQVGIERLLCQTVAQINQEPLQTELPTRSEFESLTASITLGQGQALLAPLRAELAHLSLLGEGNFDLASAEFNARLEAQLSPDLASLDPACRVNERLTAIAWPVNCSGSPDTAPAGWCKVDSREIIRELASSELQRKAREEGGKLLQRLLQRDQPATEEDNP
ncbi:AsmA family protein [Kineobactrum salinum]|uniref:AsmA family protein n=1 Tax=Kineobactrum salinum TaxID=2708301 RepID=A0A6C0U0A4_9GAMM|nr:AsmA family protein [Kineobactrum salinum]QIB65338.1 AsmA family protein [Kineobactrum salinum]